MKYKKLLVIGIAVLTISFLVGTGFNKRTDVALTDYTVSEDGTQIILKTSVMSSMGYIRGFKDNGGGGMPHYLTFYSTFGGLNSTWGAKNEFVLELGEDDTEIYFNRVNGEYELILKKKEETGVWEEIPFRDKYQWLFCYRR